MVAFGSGLGSVIPVLGLFGVASFRILPATYQIINSVQAINKNRSLLSEISIDLAMSGESLHLSEAEVMEFELGNNLLFWGMGELLADPERLPAMSEMIHYPYLFAGYLALFFTALNLLPIGQLDGGHVVFGLFPKKHALISLIAFVAFLAYAGMGLIRPSSSLEELMIRIPLYLGFLYLCLSKSGLSQLSPIFLYFLRFPSIYPNFPQFSPIVFT